MRMFRIKRKPRESAAFRQRRRDDEYMAKYEARKAAEKANPDSRCLYIHPLCGGRKERDAVGNDWLRDGLVVGAIEEPELMGYEHPPVTVYGELLRSDLPQSLQRIATTIEHQERERAKAEAAKAKELKEAIERRDRILAGHKEVNKC